MLLRMRLAWLPMRNGQDARLRGRDGFRLGPLEVGQDRAGLVDLGSADQERKATSWGDQPGRHWEYGFEAFDCTECHEPEESGLQGFGADGLYLDVRQLKDPDHFAQEGGFLVIGLDQADGDLRCPDFEGEARESGAGANVGDEGMVVGCWLTTARVSTSDSFHTSGGDNPPKLALGKKMRRGE